MKTVSKLDVFLLWHFSSKLQCFKIFLDTEHMCRSSNKTLYLVIYVYNWWFCVGSEGSILAILYWCILHIFPHPSALFPYNFSENLSLPPPPCHPVPPLLPIHCSALVHQWRGVAQMPDRWDCHLPPHRWWIKMSFNVPWDPGLPWRLEGIR